MTGQLLFGPAAPARPAAALRVAARAGDGAELSGRAPLRPPLGASRPARRTRSSPGWARSRSATPSASPTCAGPSRAGRAPLKSFLLDQRRIAGVGNIYADEALFRARLHPLRAAGSVGPREAQRLHAALLETLQAGIDHEGSSIESFVDPAGERGSFQEILNVYQRTGEPCRVCGTPIRRIVVGGRGTHFCPRCQPRRGGMSRGSRSRLGSTTSVGGRGAGGAPEIG